MKTLVFVVAFVAGFLALGAAIGSHIPTPEVTLTPYEYSLVEDVMYGALSVHDDLYLDEIVVRGEVVHIDLLCGAEYPVENGVRVFDWTCYRL